VTIPCFSANIHLGGKHAQIDSWAIERSGLNSPQIVGHMKTIVVLAVAALSLPARAGIIAGPVTNPANGHAYYLLSSTTWTKSEAEATSLGGHLATIRNAAENRWVFSTFGGFSSALWIGLSDPHKTRQYAWASGEPVTYVNWSGGQPDNRPDDGGTEFYAHIWPRVHAAPGQWNDYGDGDTVLGFPLCGVVEIIPSENVRLSLPIGSRIGESVAPANSLPPPPASPELHASTAIELTWPSEAGRVYQVQWTASMGNPQWKNLGSALRATGTVLSVFDSTREHPQALYRLQIVQ